jgi:hypothetical protein
MRQLITPNPNIWCQPGWCLAYVNEAFGVPKKYGSATDAWNGSKTQHRDRDFPPGVWVPVWYGLDTTPLGHVVLLAPDRSVYSTSDLSNTPRHHPDLADLEAYYAYYGMKLTYRGWTEDVEDTPVLADGPSGLAAQGDITPITEPEGFLMALNEQDQQNIYEAVGRNEKEVAAIKAELAKISARIFGRDVQRWYHPDNPGDVRTYAFEGSVSARSTDVNDVLSTNRIIEANTNKILTALSGLPGIDANVIAGLREQLAAELKSATESLSVTLTVKDD